MEKPGAASSLAFGEYGLKALEPAWITDRQIEASRVAITRFIKRGGKLWIRIFPDKPFTKKPAETRMGKGKGPPEHWVAVVKPGRVMFEMAGVDLASATEAMELAATSCRSARNSSPARENSDAAASGEIPADERGRTRNAPARAGRTDFPAALSADHRADGRREEAARGAQGTGAREDVAARAAN